MIDLESYVRTLNGKPAAVVGLGVSGLATINALTAAGASVRAWDDDPARRKAAEDVGASILDTSTLGECALMVLSPGIPLNFPQPHPLVMQARAAGVEIVGDIEILHRSGHGLKTIGITGTNGKSTVTSLIAHVLGVCGIRAAIGGNIGKAALGLDLDGRQVIVLELSSYQLDLCTNFSPDIAIHLNLTPDHIDRHGSLDGYRESKMRIFRGNGVAIIGVDDESSRAMADKATSAGVRTVYKISTTGRVDRGAYVDGSMLFDAMGGMMVPVGDLAGFPALKGAHNYQNAASSYAACRLMGVKPESIMAAMMTYPGLPHRMFTVRTINGIPYIDDSKATNADAAAKALACYRNIFWILGGRAKEGGLNGLEKLMDHVCHAFTIGEAEKDFASWLDHHHVPVTRCGTLDKAVESASREAQAKAESVVLLSPACASFDQFRSFEHRGEVFRDLVGRIPEIRGASVQ